MPTIRLLNEKQFCDLCDRVQYSSLVANKNVLSSSFYQLLEYSDKTNILIWHPLREGKIKRAASVRPESVRSGVLAASSAEVMSK